MDSFDDRRDAFEKKHAHDEALRFKVDVRANKLLGEWAAEKLNLTGEAVKNYVESVIHADFEEPGREDVFRKVKADLADLSSETEIREAMAKTHEVAVTQIQQDTSS